MHRENGHRHDGWNRNACVGKDPRGKPEDDGSHGRSPATAANRPTPQDNPKHRENNHQHGGWPRRAYQEFCVIGLLHVLRLFHCEAFAEEDGELGPRRGPFSLRHFPVAADAAQDQIEQLDRGFIGREVSAAPDRAA